MSPPPLRRAVRLIEQLDRALGYVDRFVVVACCALLFGLFAVVILAVFFRYVVNSSLLWGEELVRYMAIWLVFLGLSSAHRRNEHVSINSLLGHIPGITRPLARRIGEAVTLVFCLLVTWFGTQAAAGNFANHQVSPAMQIGIAWIYLAIPVGFGLLSLQSLVRVFRPPHDRDPEREVLA
ncbi:TRAP transporter small permease [Parafrigoribacterium mesophilum]|uniref:TRAP transporter small permease n=1 Tax=Parafrigoribacterium mesophilum TaxID=433646 RepID=UPI0031FBC51D